MIVVDASVICKWIVNEHDDATVSARQLRKDYLDGIRGVIAPDILLYEVANIFSNRLGLTFGEARSAWESLVSFDVPIFVPNKSFVGDCFDFSRKYKVSVYDASYLVLAKVKQCTLFTDDKKLINRVNLPFVKQISSYPINNP